MKEHWLVIKPVVDFTVWLICMFACFLLGYTIKASEDKPKPIKYGYVSFENEDRLRKDADKRYARRKASSLRKSRRVPVDSTNTRDSMWVQ